MKIQKPMTQRVARRAFLRGAGSIAVGLPFLNAFELVFPRSRAQAQAAGDPRYCVIIRQGNGVAQQSGREAERFWPKALGALTTADLMAQTDRATSVLAPYASRLLLVKGTKFGFQANGCGHSGGGNQVLTAAKVSSSPSGSKSLAMGESVDTYMARQINPDAREPLTLMTGSTSGFLPVVLSYTGPKELRGAENDPFTVYKRMTGLAGMDESVVSEIATRRKSVNDLLRTQLQSMLVRPELSAEDKRRLDQHFSSIRDFENRAACTLPEMRERELDGVSAVDGKNYVAVTQMHMDLVALSFACDNSRVATIQMGQGNDATEHSIPGFRNGEKLPRYHQISHRIYGDGTEGDPIEGAFEMHHEIDKLHARLFAYLVDKLEATPGPNGTMLDSGVAVWTNDISVGPSHSYSNIPWVMAGNLGGYLKNGAYIDAGGVTHNQLLNTLLTGAGCTKEDGSPVDNFGDASLKKGLIAGMMA